VTVYQTPLQKRTDVVYNKLYNMLSVFVRSSVGPLVTRHEQVIDVVQHFVYMSHKLAKNGGRSRRTNFYFGMLFCHFK